MNMAMIARSLTAWVGRFQDLDGTVQEMFYLASLVRKNAQAPYSHYWVGVTVQSAKTGNIYRGCNVERGSWTQTSHAEQATLDSMVAVEGAGTKPSRLVLLAGPEGMEVFPSTASDHESGDLVTDVSFNQIPSPCGHCLQCIWENCHEDGSVELYGSLPTGEVTMVTIDNAFPLKFGPVDLGVKY